MHCGAADPGGSVKFSISVNATGRYAMELYATTSPYFAKIQTIVDGKAYEPLVDLYALDVKPTGKISIGGIELDTGTHDLGFNVIGRSANALGYSFGLDAITLTLNPTIALAITPIPTATSIPQPTPTPAGVYATFVNVKEGSTVKGVLDSKGIPIVPITVELNGSVPQGKPWPENLVLGVEYLQQYPGSSFTWANTGELIPIQKTLPFRAEFRWSPTKPGTYRISARANNPTTSAQQGNGYELSSWITVQVSEMPKSPILQRMIDLYRERFNLKLTAPAVSRYEGNDPSQRRWLSAAYIENMEYTIDVFDDGRIESRAINLKGQSGEGGSCRPSGRYRMLVVFVDYGNTGITKEQAQLALLKAQAVNNNLNTLYSRAHGLTTPILQVELTGVFISPPPHPGELLTVNDIKAKTSYDRSQFDLIAQLDLDKNNTYGKPRGLVGLSTGGCWQVAHDAIDLWVPSQNLYEGALDYDLQYTLLAHEFLHSMGWIHDWACEKTILFGGFAMCDWGHPPILLGWDDLDGDGIPEIVDSTPYGLQK